MLQQTQYKFNIQFALRPIIREGNFYTNFDVPAFPKKVDKNIRALIYGNCGSGKTRFFNKMCLTKQKQGVTKGSLTKDLIYSDCVHIQNGRFTLYDNPGADSKTQALMHAMIIRKSLTTTSLDLLLIQVQFDCRFQRTIEQIYEKLQLFNKYTQNIIVLVSHLDKLDQIHKDKIERMPQQQKKILLQQFYEQLAKVSTKLKVILYSNEYPCHIQISKVLYAVGYLNEKVNIEISDAQFFQYFNITGYSIKAPQSKLKKYTKEIEQIAKRYLNYIKKVNLENSLGQSLIHKKSTSDKNQIPLQTQEDQNMNDMQNQMVLQSIQDSQNTKSQSRIKDKFDKNISNDNFLSSFKASMKKQLQEKQITQEKQYSHNLSDQQSLDLFLTISQYIHAQLQQVDLVCEGKFKRQTYVGADPDVRNMRDLFKKCPNCGILWMKTYGCQGDVICGDIVPEFDIIDRTIVQYQFVKSEQGIESVPRIKEQITKAQRIQLIEKSIQTYLYYKQNPDKRIGCGHKFIWSLQPVWEEIDEKLKQIYQVNNFEEMDIELKQKLAQRQILNQELNDKLEQTICKMWKSAKQKQ